MIQQSERDVPVLEDGIVRAFEERLAGTVLRPGDAGYDEARRVWSGAADRFPALIVRCADAVDVARAVTFAREHGLPLAVRSGGHSFAGYGTVDGGLVLDLSAMNGVDIDPARRIAWVEAGATSNDLARAAQAHGLALSTGDTATVGLGGLTLGGGIGWMVRQQGLTIDNLLAVDLVTADGSALRASEAERPELFWALRGGGGNFGVATRFRFRLHPVETVLGGMLVYPARGEILHAIAARAAEAPDELTTMTFIMKAPPLPFIPAELVGSPIIFLVVCSVGPRDEGERALAPLRSIAGGPVADMVSQMPYPGMFEFGKPGEVRGLHQIVRSGFMRTLDRDVADALVAHVQRGPSAASMAQVRVLGGAMARVPADATAFAHRDQLILASVFSTVEDGASADDHQRWVEGAWRAMRPRVDGVYVNFLSLEGDERVREAYPAATYARLAEVKRRYDPTNVFRLNQNIRPSS